MKINIALLEDQADFFTPAILEATKNVLRTCFVSTIGSQNIELAYPVVEAVTEESVERVRTNIRNIQGACLFWFDIQLFDPTTWALLAPSLVPEITDHFHEGQEGGALRDCLGSDRDYQPLPFMKEILLNAAARPLLLLPGTSAGHEHVKAWFKEALAVLKRGGKDALLRSVVFFDGNAQLTTVKDLAAGQNQLKRAIAELHALIKSEDMPHFHRDRIINEALLSWSQPFRSSVFTPSALHWNHALCQTAAYKSIAEQWFCNDDKSRIGIWKDGTSASDITKTLFGCHFANTGKGPTWSNLGKRLSRATFQGILERLEIPNPTVVDDHNEGFLLPLSPGMPFLLALRQYVIAHGSEDEPPAKRVVCGLRRNEGFPKERTTMFIRVEWSDVDNPQGFARRFAEHVLMNKPPRRNSTLENSFRFLALAFDFAEKDKLGGLTVFFNEEKPCDEYSAACFSHLNAPDDIHSRHCEIFFAAVPYGFELSWLAAS